jgi:D-alanyl-D-alanine carboxypeptidase
MDGKVLVANPALANPMLDATEFTPDSRERGRITLAGAFGNHGETVQLRHDARGKASEFWLGGTKMLPERRVAKELSTREGGSPEAAMEDVDA